VEISKREFLARFGGLAAGGLFVPETAGFFEGNFENGPPIYRSPSKDVYEAVYFCYGKMAFSGPEVYHARRVEGAFEKLLDRELKGFRQDMLAWKLKPLEQVWPDPT
jgi:hypothetical protein